MSWVRLTGKYLPDLQHTPGEAKFYDAVMVIVSQKLDRKYRVLNPGPVVCESITQSAHPQLLPPDRNTIPCDLSQIF